MNFDYTTGAKKGGWWGGRGLEGQACTFENIEGRAMVYKRIFRSRFDATVIFSYLTCMATKC
ncbi:hypothetical protein WN48_11002 [Eufriesea mexicana]|uniref:Uncharacterized protein n=1 Tax=Eufriesea mexicana TaxID=516756 RepID=A0A310S5X1_9HYME|nr:hypothetical protein WN48_11002 [Eufriesea mexicana]